MRRTITTSWMVSSTAAERYREHGGTPERDAVLAVGIVAFLHGISRVMGARAHRASHSKNPQVEIPDMIVDQHALFQFRRDEADLKQVSGQRRAGAWARVLDRADMGSDAHVPSPLPAAVAAATTAPLSAGDKRAREALQAGAVEREVVDVIVDTKRAERRSLYLLGDAGVARGHRSRYPSLLQHRCGRGLADRERSRSLQALSARAHRFRFGPLARRLQEGSRALRGTPPPRIGATPSRPVTSRLSFGSRPSMATSAPALVMRVALVAVGAAVAAAVVGRGGDAPDGGGRGKGAGRGRGAPPDEGGGRPPGPVVLQRGAGRGRGAPPPPASDVCARSDVDGVESSVRPFAGVGQACGCSSREVSGIFDDPVGLPPGLCVGVPAPLESVRAARCAPSHDGLGDARVVSLVTVHDDVESVQVVPARSSRDRVCVWVLAECGQLPSPLVGLRPWPQPRQRVWGRLGVWDRSVCTGRRFLQLADRLRAGFSPCRCRGP